MKLLDNLLLLFLLCLPIHRIDLANDQLGFVVTPVLLMSLIIILYFLCFSIAKKRLRFPKVISTFSFILALIALWFGATVIFLQDFIQFKRLVLFYIIVFSTITFFLLFNYSKNKHKITQDFIWGSLKIYCIFSIVQGLLFYYGTQSEPVLFISLLPQTIGPYFPRLTGGFIDPNLGGYFLIFLYILIYRFSLTKKFNWLIITLIFLTLSRSAIAAFIIIELIRRFYEMIIAEKNVRPRPFIKRPFRKAFLLSALIIITSSLFLFTNMGDRFGDAVNARLYNEDNSTSIHLELFKVAASNILDNPINFLVGYGFGSSFLYTEQFFPGNKYGNFHTELLSIMFETGLIGLLIYLFFFIFPLYLFIKKPLVNNFYLLLILVAAILQGIFYQQYLFHYYWIMIGMVWYFLDPELNE